jgi:hypothetical protein
MTNRWPLIERNISRLGCLRWLTEHGYPEPPKSACIGCPFHNDRMWKEMKANQPDEFEDACKVDDAMRRGEARGMRGVEFMHRKRIPLRDVTFDDSQPDLFQNECEGICGV